MGWVILSILLCLAPIAIAWTVVVWEHEFGRRPIPKPKVQSKWPPRSAGPKGPL